VVVVTGEYAYIHAQVADPGGHIARNALVRLYRREPGGRLVSVADRWGGVLDADGDIPPLQLLYVLAPLHLYDAVITPKWHS
jgi:hypothetical protein